MRNRERWTTRDRWVRRGGDSVRALARGRFGWPRRARRRELDLFDDGAAEDHLALRRVARFVLDGLLGDGARRPGWVGLDAVRDVPEELAQGAEQGRVGLAIDGLL